MSRGHLLNLGLLVFIGALVLLVVYEPGIEAPQEKPRLLDIERDAVKQIRIARKGQETVALSQDEYGNWKLTEPLEIAAGDYRINSLLKITDQKSLGSYPADKETLARFGLSNPKIVLTLNDSVRIAFGDSTPLDQRRYAQIGDRVHLITDTLYYHLIGQYTTFIRQKLLPDNAEIAALTLPGLELQWKENRWEIEHRPDNYSVDQVTRLIDAWKLASAIQVEPYDGNKGETITIKLKSREKPVSFLLTAHSPDLILARPDLGIQYHLADSSAAELLTLMPLEEDAEE